jgi:hypothetical protein
MVEQGWEQEEAVVSAMRKGGWSGRRKEWREVRELEVVRFRGDKEDLEWSEFERWREWEGKNGKGTKRV